MAKLKRVGRDYRLFFSDFERDSVDDLLDREFEIAQAKEGVWVLLEQEEKTQKTESKKTEKPAEPVKTKIPASEPKKNIGAEINKTDEKIFGILNDKKQLSNRIVGKFEKTLSENEVKRLNELVKLGVIEQFKLNPSYKNPIYRLNEKKLSEFKKQVAELSPEASLEKNGFAVFAGEQTAREISERYNAEFKAGELKGLKSFDGSFLAIRKKTYGQSQSKITGFLENQKQSKTADEIANATQLPAPLVRICCEFLKEDGILFEKTKGQYKLV